MVLPVLAEPLQRGLLIFDQGHDYIAIRGVLRLADHHDITVVDAGLDHRIAADLECIMRPLTKHGLWHRDIVRDL